MDWMALFSLAQTESPAAADTDWMFYLAILLVIAIPAAVYFAARATQFRDFDWQLSLIAFSVVAASVLVWRMFPPKLGVDLSGGYVLNYQIDAEATQATGMADAVTAPQLVAPLKNRLDPGGLNEVIVRAVGDDQIEIVIPYSGDVDLERQKRLITKSGFLEFRIAADPNANQALIDAAMSAPREVVVDGERKAKWVAVAREDRPATAAEDELQPFTYSFNPQDMILRDAKTRRRLTSADMGDAYSKPRNEIPRALSENLADQGITDVQVLMLVDKYNVTGADLSGARLQPGDTGGYAIGFSLKPDGAAKFYNLTSENLKRLLSIVLDETLISSATIQSAISDSGQITGRFSKAEVQETVRILNSGRLPAILRPNPLSEQQISPLLGRDTIEKGVWATGISLVLVLLFMLALYRVAGVVACLALLTNLVCILGAMMLLKARFTLPGLAGLVLTVGMSVDANVLIFERLREELRKGAGVRMAIQNGFARATTTILDANVTTLITAIVLYIIGSEQVKGFAVTLVLGILFSMYTAIFCARVAFDIAERMGLGEMFTSMGSLFGETEFDFLGRQQWAGVGSLAVILLGIGGIFLRGSDLLDTDFTGGTKVQILTEERTTISDLRAKLAESEYFAGANVVSMDLSTLPGRVWEITTQLRGPEEQPDGSFIPPDGFEMQVVQEGTISPEEDREAILNGKLLVGVREGGDPDVDEPTAPGGTQIVETLLQARLLEGQLSRRSIAHKPLREKDLQPPPPETTPGLGPDTPTNPTAPTRPGPGPSDSAPPSDEQGRWAPPAGESFVLFQPDNNGVIPSPPEPMEESPEPPVTEPMTPGTTLPEIGPTPMPPGGSLVPPLDPDLPSFPGGGIREGVVQPGLQRQTRTTLTFGEALDDPGLQREVFGISEEQLRALLEQATTRALSATTAANIRESILVTPVEDSGQPPRYTQWQVVFPLSSDDTQQVLDVLEQRLSGDAVFPSSSEVGSSVAGDTQAAAFGALLASMVLIVLYIWFRFQRIAYGLAAVVALVHDVLVTLACIALSAFLSGLPLVDAFKISLPVVAAILTVIGYSLNDTIVVFDRIREVRGKSPDLSVEMINTSINQTLSRTVLTSLTTFLVVAILFLFGGPAIHDFAFVLLVGVIVGTYSSILVAAPALVLITQWEQAQEEAA